MLKKYYNKKFEKKYYPAFFQVQYEELMTYASIVICLSYCNMFIFKYYEVHYKNLGFS